MPRSYWVGHVLVVVAVVGWLSALYEPGAVAALQPLASPYQCRVTSLSRGVTIVEVADSDGWAATFTIGSRTVQVRAPRRRFSEPGFGAVVETRSRVLLAPRAARLDPDGRFRPPTAGLESALSSPGPDIVERAFSRLDARYQVGADWNTHQAAIMDCSGFTRWVLRQSGLAVTSGEHDRRDGALPRKSYQQMTARVGVFIPRPDLLRMGDLVFFDTHDHDGVRRATHVGIYLGTDGLGKPRFIHCTREHDGVTTYGAHLGGRYYLPRFIGGRRI
jgi:hypothetical protein